MCRSLTPEQVKASKELLDILSWPFDFDMDEPAPPDPWFKIRSGVPFQIIARDGTGGLFALCGDAPEDRKPVLYVGSEGRAGIVAANFSEWMQIITPLPYWWDLLHFSGSGQLEEMKRAVPYCEKEHQEDFLELNHCRACITEALGIEGLTDPVERLYRAVTELSGRFPVISPEGEPYGILFGSFVVSDNPMWRGR
jgi:hypothetical protein